ncbi:MAG: prepilin-type N-terminal cleavage/methylation domain-containing protein [Lachnospiraceae bacterium]|nr:prepilin-type N-terminal cleavage/methylation domain-containing protein [Lachnospiraceae bacterium]
MRNPVWSVKKDNRGFTIVELLIAVALVGLVGSAVFGFMTVGARTFTSTSSDVNLQSESQLAFNQMQDIIIDTAVGIDYSYAPAGCTDLSNDSNYIKVVEEDVNTATAAGKRLTMYNMDKIYELSWERDASDPVQSKLYYTEYAPINTGTTLTKGSPEANANHVLMAEYISDFKVDLTRMNDKRIVRLETTYVKNNKEYTSSHNITLRNKPVSGNTIPAYVDPVPSATMGAIHGPVELFVKPGETGSINPSGNTYYQEDSNGVFYYNNSTIDYQVVASPQKASGTGISSSGVLSVSQGQTDDFTIRVFSTVSSHYLDVTVHVIRVTGITLTPTTTATLDETGTGVYNNLIKDEEFSLTASVNGNYLDKTSSISGAGIDDTVSWTITKGAAYFEIVSSDGYSCSCKMKSVFTLSGSSVQNVGNRFQIDNIEVTATSNESVNTPKYMDFLEGAYAPVTAKFQGYALTSKGDFNIKINESNLKRGKQYTVNYAGFAEGKPLFGDITMPDGNTIDWTQYFCIVEVNLVENVHKVNGEIDSHELPHDDFIDTKNDNGVTGTGNNWHFQCPMTLNPNAEYTYTICMHIVKAKDGDEYSSDHQTIQTAPYKDYTTSDYVYSSNTVTATFNRLLLNYQYGSNKYDNLVITDNKENAIYFPRSFDTTSPSKVVEMFMTYDQSFQPDGGYSNKDFSFEWAFFRYNSAEEKYIDADGKEIAVYDYDENAHTYRDSSGNATLTTDALSLDASQYPKSEVNGIFTANNVTNNLFGVKFDMGGYESKSKTWGTVENHFRMIPFFVTHDSGNNTVRHALFSNYVDIYTNNIEIPATGMIAKLVEATTGTREAEESYFPSPLDLYNSDIKVKFPGETTGNTMRSWTGACCRYAFPNFPETIRYTIKRSGSADNDRYDLTLYAQHKTTHAWTEFAKYYCSSESRVWTLETIYD